MNVAGFWTRVQRGDGCWGWTGRKKPTGYGIYHDGNTSRHAHRIAYELTVGPVPPGLELHHTCENRGCVNPAHLSPVTHDQNMKIGRGNQWRGKTHCVNGHPLSGENVRHYLTRGRFPSRCCIECSRIRQTKAHKASRRAA